jgi:hypothetical protein
MPIKTITALFIAITLAFSSGTQAAETLATGDDGREVILNNDGSWTYKSTDRYANTSDGRRILLREDGSWVYIGNQKAVSPVQYRNTDIDIGLTRVEIEEYKKPATGIKKSPRLSTETNFYFTATVTSTGDPISPNVRSSKGEISGFIVSDDYGKEYKVLELSPVDVVQLKPGESINYRLKIQESPKWGPKTVTLSIDKNVFDTTDDILLTAIVKDIEHIEGGGK